jgi:hypothetical protein
MKLQQLAKSLFEALSHTSWSLIVATTVAVIVAATTAQAALIPVALVSTDVKPRQVRGFSLPKIK